MSAQTQLQADSMVDGNKHKYVTQIEFNRNRSTTSYEKSPETDIRKNINSERYRLYKKTQVNIIHTNNKKKNKKTMNSVRFEDNQQTKKHKRLSTEEKIQDCLKNIEFDSYEIFLQSKI